MKIYARQEHMKKWKMLTFSLLTICICGVTSSGALAETLRLPLNKMVPFNTVDLRCTTAAQPIQIPIPERWEVKNVILSFDYTNSTGLLEGKSRMMITLNDYPVTQINLHPLIPEGSVKLAIPSSLFEPGYNELLFSVSQHYTLDCEQPCASDLWTTLNFDQGFIEIEYDLKPVPLKLAATNDFLFDPKLMPKGDVNIVLENTSPEIVAVAGIVASGIARRFDYKKVRFTTSSSIRPGVDNVLVGSNDFLQDFLQDLDLPPVDVPGPLLKIMHLPIADNPFDPDYSDDPVKVDMTHALLIVSGVDTNQLMLAAETLAVISSYFPNGDKMIVTEFSMLDITMYGGKQIVMPEKEYTFKTLNFNTHTFKGINPAQKELTFRLPADLLIKPNVYVDITLYYAYGAAMREDTTLNVSLNGQEIRAIHLNNTNGDLIEGYQVRIPTYMFKPGDNAIQFQAVMTSLSSISCENVQTKNLFLTIFDNSTIIFPKMPHFTELPNLALFMLNGYPMTRWPDGNDSTVFLTNQDNNTINSALNVLGMITQKNGYPLFEVKFTYTDPQQYDGELLIIGDIPSIPDIYKNKAPLKLTRETTVPYPVMRSWADEETLAYSKQISGFNPGQGALMQFLSPYTEGRSILLMTAATTNDLLVMSDAVTDSFVQSQVAGDLVLIDLTNPDPDYTVASMTVGEKYIAGKTADISVVDRYLYVYPWIYYVAIIFITISLSLLLFYQLRKIRAGKQRGTSVDDED
jgi:hypothetical protein